MQPQDSPKKPWEKMMRTEKSFFKRLLQLAVCGTAGWGGGMGQQKSVLVTELKR